MVLRRKGPAFPKFKSGTLTRRGIMRNDDREPVRRIRSEEPTIKWQPEARRAHEQWMRDHNYNENKVWDAMREKFGLQVYSLFQELSSKHFSGREELKHALFAIEFRFLKKEHPEKNFAAITHQAVQNLKSLGFE